jgi:predicted RNA binding protein YcfA (HicA-like mRNA interferase family)
MKVKEVIALVQSAGWRQVRQKGSHRQFKHPDRPGIVTIAGHVRDEVHPKTLGSIMRQAGLK